MVNLFGKGFIGSYYTLLDDCIVNDRNDLTPKTNKILYLISTTDNYNVKNNPYIDIETNLTTLIRVLENCKHVKDIEFNFASSWFVYGDVNSHADENSYCNPKGFYSITKRAAEQLLISYCQTHNIKYRILRFANVLGPGDVKVSAKKNALTYLTRKIVNGEGVNLYDNGNFYRDYIHVKDLCSAIKMILENGEMNTIYNVGTGVPTLFKNAIDYVVSKSNSTSTITNIEQTDFHKTVQVKSFYMNCEKLRMLGFNPKYSIYDTLDSLIAEAKKE